MVPLISQEILRSVVHDTDASEAQLRQIVRASRNRSTTASTIR